ncbi:21343_t:CDS:1 [Cetraspora pellucida]|uniref:21343_t:CDS:1 n=1 Tax=Cetraspora pellucida TaxID=1433469 RepID=A0A9N8ZWY1_9GLOM|nr:21343_t:CDS:1 [Cetraspora pellucida]
MSDNSSFLAATVPTDDVASHVVLNTSIGSPPHSDSEILPTFPRRESYSPPNIYHGQRNPGDNLYSENKEQPSTVVPFYRRPQFYGTILRTFAFNFFFPFINGVMLGFGEICANEIAFRMGWFGVRSLPLHYRRTSMTRSRETNRSGKSGREIEADDENEKTMYVEMTSL